MAVFVLVALVLVTVDFRSPDRSEGFGGRVRAGVATVLGPVQDGLSTLVRPVSDAASSVTDLFRIRQENARLRAQLARVEERRLSYNDVVRENEQLRAQLGLQERLELETVSAHVIAQGASNFEWTATLDVGEDDGVSRDMAVVNGDGLVGRVIAATASTSRILLSVDPNFGAAARIADSGGVGLLSGDGNEPMLFEPLVVDAEIEVGQEVVTSAYLGGTFTPGIPIGVVTAADFQPGQLTRVVDVLPYVDFSTLDVVSVVLTVPDQDVDPIELETDPPYTPPPVDPQRQEELPSIPAPSASPADEDA